MKTLKEVKKENKTYASLISKAHGFCSPQKMLNLYSIDGINKPYPENTFNDFYLPNKNKILSFLVSEKPNFLNEVKICFNLNELDAAILVFNPPIKSNIFTVEKYLEVNMFVLHLFYIAYAEAFL